MKPVETAHPFKVCAIALITFFALLALKRFPPDLNRRDSQRVKDERIFVH